MSTTIFAPCAQGNCLKGSLMGLGGSLWNGGVGSLEGMAVGLGAAGGALFGAVTYATEQVTQAASAILKNRFCPQGAGSLNFILKPIEWLLPRLAGLAACAAAGFALGAWQAIALVVMNLIIPPALFLVALVANKSCGQESCFSNAALIPIIPFIFTGAPAILSEMTPNRN